MPRRHPPEGYITSKEALSIVGSMLYKYVKSNVIKPYGPDESKHKYYKRSEVEAARNRRESFFNQGKVIRRKNETEFMRATVEDVKGIYQVASELFPLGTTSAEDRKPLIEARPEGNYIVKENGEIVAYIILHPTHPDGEVEQIVFAGRSLGRPWGPSDIDDFAPGKTVNVLVRSIGVTQKYGEQKARHYMQRLLLGTRDELEKLGKQGITIRMLYGVSESKTGIAMCVHAGMVSVKKMAAQDKLNTQGRHIFVLDVEASDLPLLQPYKRALAEWQRTQTYK